jgi:hypothetical protein
VTDVDHKLVPLMVPLSAGEMSLQVMPIPCELQEPRRVTHLLCIR